MVEEEANFHALGTLAVCPWHIDISLSAHVYKKTRSLQILLSKPAPTLRSWARIPLEAWIFVYVLCAFILCTRVEAGTNTSTVIPASRKRRQKGNPVVSGETVPADLRKGS
jgi:hypothetical protein